MINTSTGLENIKVVYIINFSKIAFVALDSIVYIILTQFRELISTQIYDVKLSLCQLIVTKINQISIALCTIY